MPSREQIFDIFETLLFQSESIFAINQNMKYQLNYQLLILGKLDTDYTNLSISNHRDMSSLTMFSID